MPKNDYFYGLGRRKSSTARARLSGGKGNITVNEKPASEYFNGNEACIVAVDPSHKPAYIQNGDGKEEFFVRMGNSTQPFSMSEAEEYIKTRWK